MNSSLFLAKIAILCYNEDSYSQDSGGVNDSYGILLMTLNHATKEFSCWVTSINNSLACLIQISIKPNQGTFYGNFKSKKRDSGC